MSWLYPFVAFFLSVSFSIFFCFLYIPYFVPLNSKIWILKYVLIILHYTGIIDYFYHVFLGVFCQRPYMYKFTIIFSTLILMKLNLATKYYIVVPTLSNTLSFLYLILLFFFIFCNYIRFIIGLAYLFTLSAVSLTPHMVPSPVLYIVTGDGSSGTPVPPESTDSSKKSFYSFLTIQKNQYTHHHRYMGNGHRGFVIAGFLRCYCCCHWWCCCRL
jgi:hypothetical protein